MVFQCCGWRVPLRALSFLALILFSIPDASAQTHPTDARWSGGCLVEFRHWQGPESDPYDPTAVYFDEAVHRYALDNAQTTPEYRFGVSAKKKRNVFQFLAPCAEAQRTFNAMFAAWRGSNRQHVNVRVYSVRPPTAEALTTIQFLFYRPRFWRRDCIVGLFPVLGEAGKLRERGPFLDFLLTYIKDRLPELPLLRFSGKRNGSLFIQFFTQCDRRIKVARELVAEFAKRTGSDPQFQVSERVFEPGPGTMEHGGAEWLDHYFPVPPATPLPPERHSGG